MSTKEAQAASDDLGDDKKGSDKLPVDVQNLDGESSNIRGGTGGPKDLGTGA